MTINLWIFPELDFSDWCELVGSPEVASYKEYVTLLAAVQADQERLGNTVRRVYFSVAEMREQLADLGLDNTPGNRSIVTASR